MLKGLVIRQAFVVLDMTLAVLVLAVTYLVVVKAVEQPADLQAAGAGLLEAPPVEFSKISPRAEYDAITEGGLFGDAGRVKKIVAAEAASPEAVTTEVTKLPWKLWGTVGAYPLDPLGSAVIEVPNAAPPKQRIDTYFISNKIFDRITLAEVHPRKVVLFNEATNTREILEMDYSQTDMLLASMTENVPIRAPVAPTQTEFVLKKQDIISEIVNNGRETLDQLALQTKHDSSGKMIGITSPNLSKVPMAKQMGLQDGDVVQEINGNKITSQENLAGLLPKLQESNQFEVVVLRKGKKSVLKYKLE
jgi:general secretion pathway protein C